MKKKLRAVHSLLFAVFAIVPYFWATSVNAENGALLNPNNFRAETRVDLTLTILHNNDGESQIINAGSGLADFGGIARFASVVDKLRNEAEASRGPKKRIVITLNSGDNFLAGPEFNASLQQGVPFFDSIALNRIGYDALALGNHEFDFGPDTLENFILGFENPPPFVSANLDFSNEPGLEALSDNRIITKATVIRKKGERFGVVGATTPELPFISSPRNVIVMDDVAAAVQEQISAISREGVNKIILISHLQGIEEDLALAGLLRGVDIMIAGGGSELLADPGDLLVPGDSLNNAFGSYPVMATGADGNRIAVVTTPGDYRYVGRLIVAFNARGEVLNVDTKSGLVRVAGGNHPDAIAPDPFIQSNVVEPVKDYVEGLAANVIATSEVALEGRRSPGIRTMETNLGNLTADALFYQASALATQFGAPLPDVALQNSGGIRNNSLIPAGNITELSTFDIFPFANFVCIVPGIPRAQFKEIMENAVSQIPASDGRFAQISGFRLVYNPAGTAQTLDANLNVVTPGARVRSIILDSGAVIVENGAVVPGEPINIATNDFSARGGDMYPFRGALFTTLGVVYQQALFNFIVDSTAEGGLGGVITSADYPAGGEGRISAMP